VIKLYSDHDKSLGSRDNCSTRTAFLPIQQRIQGGRVEKAGITLRKWCKFLVGRSKSRKKIMMYIKDVEYVDFNWVK